MTKNDLLNMLNETTKECEQQSTVEMDKHIAAIARKYCRDKNFSATEYACIMHGMLLAEHVTSMQSSFFYLTMAGKIQDAFKEEPPDESCSCQ